MICNLRFDKEVLWTQCWERCWCIGYSSVCRYRYYRSRTGLRERITEEESKRRSIEV